jgi:bifunctional NMN adenylyltransferase/nudix hydrolase
MIKSASAGLALNIYVEANTDTIYNDQAWAVRVQALVAKHTKPGDRVGIIGHKKDDSSFYLDMFPQWGFEDVELIEFLSAVNIRDLFFKRDVNMSFIKGVVPASTFDFLMKFKETEEYEQIIREREFVINYKKQYASLPYPPIFSTADAVVIQSGHVLMVKRRAEPGKGLWALPGGYVNANTDKSVEAAMLRELREETQIKVPAPVLKGSIVRSKVFDAIDRSPRGRLWRRGIYGAVSLSHRAGGQKHTDSPRVGVRARRDDQCQCRRCAHQYTVGGRDRHGACPECSDWSARWGTRASRRDTR